MGFGITGHRRCWLNVRFGPLCGLKADISQLPFRANSGHHAKSRIATGNVIDAALLCVVRHVDGVSTKPCCHRPTNPARAAPRHGASQKSQSWPIYMRRPANSAGPVLRAGLTDAFVTGIRNRLISVRHSPIGMPANPTAAPFEVVPMITYSQKASNQP